MEVVNPDTPLAFLPPDTATLFETVRYIDVGTLGMYLWDVLTNLKGDVRLLTQHPIGLPTIAYFLARLSAFSFVFNSALFITTPGDCVKMGHAETISFSLSVSSTSFLFLLRVLALYKDHRLTTYFFAFLWVATAACSTTIPIGVHSGHLGPTNFCTRNEVHNYVVTAVIAVSVYDTLVFLFISYWLIQNKTTLKGRMKSFFTRADLPALQRAVLQNGQEYYLIAVGINIIAMGVIFASDSLPTIAYDLFTVPNVALSNAMICRVHRDLKLGRIQQNAVIESTQVRGLQPRDHHHAHSISNFQCWNGETEEESVAGGQGGMSSTSTKVLRGQSPEDLELGYVSAKVVGTDSRGGEGLQVLPSVAPAQRVHLSMQMTRDGRDSDEIPRRFITSSQGPY